MKLRHFSLPWGLLISSSSRGLAGSKSGKVLRRSSMMSSSNLVRRSEDPLTLWRMPQYVSRCLTARTAKPCSTYMRKLKSVICSRCGGGDRGGPYILGVGGIAGVEACWYWYCLHFGCWFGYLWDRGGREGCWWGAGAKGGRGNFFDFMAWPAAAHGGVGEQSWAWRGEKPWQIAIDKSSCPRSPLI